MKPRTLICFALLLFACVTAGAYFLLRGSQPVLLEAVSEAPDPAEIADGQVPLSEAPAGEDPFAAFTEEQRAAMDEVLALVNAARQEASLAPLTLSPVLCTAAQTRAGECVSTFSHTRPDGTSYKTALTDLGVTTGYCGENAATGHTTAQQAVERWLQSEGHRANILNSNYTQLGVGMAPNTGSVYRGCAWVQLFTS
ncbi:MAG: CAP domain-containing protein [Oscillospiraceae bacterium]|nr:CAP domain-containing protein [Oscillospiraceae bacterium]